MTEKETLLHSPEGVNQMRDEVKRFFILLGEMLMALKYRFPDSSISVRENKYLDGGFNYMLDNCTLVSEYRIPSHYTTAGAKLNLAIFDLRFDKHDSPLDATGMVDLKAIGEDHRLAYTSYAYSLNNKMESRWAVVGIEDWKNCSTEDLVDEWVKIFCQKAGKQ